MQGSNNPSRAVSPSLQVLSKSTLVDKMPNKNSMASIDIVKSFLERQVHREKERQKKIQLSKQKLKEAKLARQMSCSSDSTISVNSVNRIRGA
jgi:hypothetical protein